MAKVLNLREGEKHVTVQITKQLKNIILGVKEDFKLGNKNANER